MAANLVIISLSIIIYVTIVLAARIKPPDEQVAVGQASVENPRNNTLDPIEVPIFYDPDYNYYIEIQVGDPPQRFKVNFGTKTSDSWLVGEDSVTNLANGRKYNRNASTTHVNLNSNFGFSYNGESLYVEGQLVSDQITLSNVTVSNWIFGETSDIRGHTFDLLQPNGAIGLGRLSYHSNRGQGLIKNLHQQKLISSPVYSMYFHKDQSQSPAGLLLLGGINSSLYHGDISYSPINKLNQFQIDRLTFDWSRFEEPDSRPEVPVLDQEPYQATIDPSTNMIITSRARVINAHLGAVMPTMFARFPSCNTTGRPDLVFHINGLKVTLTPDEYMLKMQSVEGDDDEEEYDYDHCYSIFVDDLYYHREYVLGTVFLKKFYTVLDYENNRIGFAEPN